MNIDALVENFYRKEDETEGLIAEVMKLLLEKATNEGVPAKESFDWNAIPEIPISELGWSDTRTRAVGGPQGGQRKLLMDYLEKIGPQADIPQKIKDLNAFMVNPDIEGQDAREKISKILSYLVFYKTLTRVITNFNASSAGFSFESFLAVLTGGEQIKTGQATIADYVTKEGEFVSLKLYNEASVEVGGSWQDLLDDLTDDTKQNQMVYIVVLKDLDGEGLDQEGTLSFYRFTLSLDNIANFIDKSSKESREMIALPLSPDGQLIDLSVQEPEAAAELQEAIQRTKVTTEDFNEALAAAVKERLTQRITQIPELEQLPGLENLINLIQLGGPNFPKLTGGGLTQAQQAVRTALDTMGQDNEEVFKILNTSIKYDPDKRKAQVKALIRNDIKVALQDTLQKLKKDPEAARVSAGQSLLKNIRLDKKSIARSIEYYNSLKGNPELQKKALFSSYGYLGAKKFGVGKGVATGKTEVDEMLVEDLGVLEIGASRIVPIIEQARGELNDQVYAIFTNLKLLSTGLNAYFASGLKDETSAKQASDASKEVATGTEKVTTQEK